MGGNGSASPSPARRGRTRGMGWGCWGEGLLGGRESVTHGEIAAVGVAPGCEGEIAAAGVGSRRPIRSPLRDGPDDYRAQTAAGGDRDDTVKASPRSVPPSVGAAVPQFQRVQNSPD